MKKLVLAITLSSTLLTLGACSSKFSEKGPDEGAGEVTPMTERLAEKQRLDEKLQKIATLGDRVKYLVNLYKTIRPPTNQADVYTPIDFFIDVTSKLQDPLPTKKGDRFVVDSDIQLPFNELSPTCRHAQARLTTNTAKSVADGQNPDVIAYEVRTCGTGSEYVRIFEINTADKNPTLNFDSAKVIEVLRNTLVMSQAPNVARLLGVQNAPLMYVKGATTCTATLDRQNILQNVQCTNLSLALSPSENVTFSDIVYSNGGPIRLGVMAKIFENGVMKADAKFQMDHDNQIKAEVTKTPSASPEVSPTQPSEQPSGQPAIQPVSQPVAQPTTTIGV